MAENAPAAAHNTWYNENQGRSTRGGHGVVKISGISGSQCSYTIGTTSSFTLGASSAVTVGAALTFTLAAQLNITAAASYAYARSATIAITHGTALSYNYSTSYSYRKGKTYSVDATDKTDVSKERWVFSRDIVNEASKKKLSSSEEETKTLTKKYTVNTQEYALNIDNTETKFVLDTSSEAVGGSKAITSQDTLNLGAAKQVNIGTAASALQIGGTQMLQFGPASFGEASASPLATLLTQAATNIQTARIALIQAKTAAVAIQDAAFAAFQAANSASTMTKDAWLAAPV
jgi:hypothetical protein